jgi:hypothetical protein
MNMQKHYDGISAIFSCFVSCAVVLGQLLWIRNLKENCFASSETVCAVLVERIVGIYRKLDRLPEAAILKMYLHASCALQAPAINSPKFSETDKARLVLRIALTAGVKAYTNLISAVYV